MHDKALTYYDRSRFLRVYESGYANLVTKLFDLLLTYDIPQIDVTSNALFHDERIVRATILAKSNGILAGSEEIGWYFENYLKQISCRFSLQDGESFVKGQMLAILQGPLKIILGLERFVLNVLQRMSAIACTASQASEVSIPSKMAATRKTYWSLLDKKAVAVGGGLTHRLSLSDGILIKDSHLDVMDRDFSKLEVLIQRFSGDDGFLVIEVDTIDELVTVAVLYHEYDFFGGVLVDNFSSVELGQAVHLLHTKHLRQSVCMEASGGITLENLSEFAHTGVDIISAGFLTMNPRLVDLSLEIC